MTRKRLFMSVFLGFHLISSVQVVTGQQNQKPLTNQDVTKMVKSGLSESTIVSAIQTNDTNFDVAADGLIELQKAGVTQKVMDDGRHAGCRGEQARRGDSPADRRLGRYWHAWLRPARARSSSTTSISRQPSCCKRSCLAYCNFWLSRLWLTW